MTPGPSWNWTQDKSWIDAVLPVSADVLHVFVGLLALITVAALSRRPPWHWWPWLAVLSLELANEAYDLMQTTNVTDEGNLGASWHDLWLTMFWPTAILLFFGRFARRAQFRARPDRDQSPE